IDVHAGFDLPVHPSIHISVADINKPTDVKVDPFGDGSQDLKNFQNLSLEDIIHGLQRAVDSLSNDSSYDFLNAKLPVINKSVHELVDFAGDLSAREQELRHRPIQTTPDGKLDGDTTLTFTVGHQPATSITVLKSATDDNASIDDLVA